MCALNVRSVSSSGLLGFAGAAAALLAVAGSAWADGDRSRNGLVRGDSRSEYRGGGDRGGGRGGDRHDDRRGGGDWGRRDRTSVNFSFGVTNVETYGSGYSYSSFGIGTGGYRGGYGYGGYRSYCPPPVAYCPPPVVVAPRPYCPPPVVVVDRPYCPPPVVVAPAPCPSPVVVVREEPRTVIVREEPRTVVVSQPAPTVVVQPASYVTEVPASKYRAAELLRDGRLNLSADLYKLYLQGSPNDQEARRSLGYALLLDGKLDDAITEIATAYQNDPRLSRTRIPLSSLYDGGSSLGTRYAELVNVANRSQTASAYLAAAVVAQSIGNTQNALANLDAARQKGLDQRIGTEMALTLTN